MKSTWKERDTKEQTLREELLTHISQEETPGNLNVIASKQEEIKSLNESKNFDMLSKKKNMLDDEHATKKFQTYQKTPLTKSTLNSQAAHSYDLKST